MERSARSPAIGPVTQESYVVSDDAEIPSSFDELAVFSLEGDGPVGAGRLEGPAAIEALRRDLLLRTGDATQAARRWVSTGVTEVDAVLGGGFPRGRLAEVTGPPSSGRTALLLATAAAATRRGEVVAWIDPHCALDVRTAAAAGVVLPHLLWVRPRAATAAWTAADIVLGTGGFALVVVDCLLPEGELPGVRTNAAPGLALSATASKYAISSKRATSSERATAGEGTRLERFSEREGPARWGDARGLSGGAERTPRGPALSQVWPRLSRGAERSGAAVVMLANRHLMGTFAALTLELSPAQRSWRGITPAHAVLTGTAAHCLVARSKLGRPERSALVQFGEETSDARGGRELGAAVASQAPAASKQLLQPAGALLFTSGGPRDALLRRDRG